MKPSSSSFDDPEVSPTASGVAEDDEAFLSPDLTNRPALIQPQWVGDRLTFGDEPFVFDLGADAFKDVLEALAAELSSLVSSLAGESNLDRKAIDFLGEMAIWVSTTTSSRVLVYRLGGAREALENDRFTVEAEWPAFPAARFAALLLQIDRILLRCRPWREFLSTTETLAQSKIEKATAVVGVFTTSLLEAGSSVVDPAISKALEDASIGFENIPASLAGRLARDRLESVSNIFKRLLERLFKTPVVQQTLATLQRAHESFWEHARTSVVTEAGKLGDKVGPGIIRLLTVCLQTLVTGELTRTGFSFLVQEFGDV